MRYGVWLGHKHDIEANRDKVIAKNPELAGKYQGRPMTYAGSIPEEVNALGTPGEKAYRLSNEMFVAYEEAGATTELLTQHLYPYYRFYGGNFMYYMRAIKNILLHEKIQRAVAEQLGLPMPPKPTKKEGAKRVAQAATLAGAYTAKTGVGLGLKAAKLFGLLGAAALFLDQLNRWNHPEAEAELPEHDQERTRIQLGKDKEGRTRTFFGGLTSTEFWRSMGFDAESGDRLLRVAKGQMSWEDYKEKHTDAFLNNWAHMRGPFVDATFAAFGINPYPDMRNPRRVRDTGKALFDILGLGQIYLAVKGKPNKWTREWDLTDEMVTQVREPGQNAYYKVRDMVRDHRTRVLGKSTYEGGIALGVRSEALYNMNKALQYGQPEKAEQYVMEYLLTYANEDDPYKAARAGLSVSVKARSPLGALAKKDVDAFILSLVPDDDIDDYIRSLPSNIYDIKDAGLRKQILLDALPDDMGSLIEHAEEYYQAFHVDPMADAIIETEKELLSPAAGTQ